MASRETCLVVGVIVSVMLLASPAFTCESAGTNTRIGEIKAIDLGKPSLTIQDSQMKKPLIFLAAPEQLKGLSLGQLVVVKYSKTGAQLLAKEIQAR